MTPNNRIPPEIAAAIEKEIDADSPQYRDDLSEGNWTKANRVPSPLLTLRIPADALTELQDLARENGVAVSTLARGFILDGIAQHKSEDLRGALERLERDLAAVKARALTS
ncbi:hypothetical protein [Gulosibacter molinativorax]|uniref:Ribbon-helix-helix protein, CopG family n=1 Tax=Gulosibacter molinativorax TaxID=256821 RepID=A0ABT7C9J6_9MICO|nr:hypothetical protein [Gulosibacter molinativorax]MDJ1371889.1 hypothetical protein [Gulosibacter molinativorax]QUY62536.1 Hypotetical protein [Gulosibacter molinativorax]